MKLICLLLLIDLVFTLQDCQEKSYSYSDSFVCVCNDKACDRLNTNPIPAADTVEVYESNDLKYRFHRSVLKENELYEESKKADLHVDINKHKRFQSIIGFGGAFTDAFGINLNTLSQPMQDRLLKDLFNQDGLEYNLARVPIAGSDFSDRPYSYDDVQDDFDLKNFSLAEDDYLYKIPHIKTGQELNPNLELFASPWAPPAWLKTSNRSKGLGILIGEPGSLHWKTYANYLVKFFDAYKANGINFWSFTPQNEPLTGLIPGYRWNTLGFSSQMMKEFIKQDLGPALEKSGYNDLKMMIYDHNTDEIFTFVRNVLNDPSAAKYISGVAYHWYGEHFYENLEIVHNRFPQFFLLSTEACEGWKENSVSLGNWTRAETYARDIIEGLNRWSTGWVDWNFALDEQGGPNWANNFVDAPIIINKTANEYYKQPMFYSLAHFTKFLPRGSVRVEHKFKQTEDENVKLTSFITPSNNLVLIVLNANDDPVTINVNGYIGKDFSMTFEGNSIKTLVTHLRS